jgi:hypothetical protein
MTHGEQNGEQTEQIPRTPGSTKPNKLGPYQPSGTPILLAGGRAVAGSNPVSPMSKRPELAFCL